MVKAAADKYAAEKKLDAARPGDCKLMPDPVRLRAALRSGQRRLRRGVRASRRHASACLPILLDVNGIEVIYNHVILVLKGVSLQVPEGSIVALLGGNGAGKTTTLRAVSQPAAGERGEVTKGSIELRGERIER